MKKHLLLITLALFGFCASYGQFVITEFAYNPGTTNSSGKQGGTEYLEILNTDTVAHSLIGLAIPSNGGNGISYTFTDTNKVNPGGYYIITNDSLSMQVLYGISAREYSGFILNSGMEIILRNFFTTDTIDRVEYENSSPWPSLGAGKGFSIELCDANSDNNDPANWKASTTYAGFINNGLRIYGTPGSMNNCPTTPILIPEASSINVDEDDGTVDVDITLVGANGSASGLTINAYAINATAGVDYSYSSPGSISFNGSSDSTISFSFDVINDTLVEMDEAFVFVLNGVTNGTLLSDSILVNIEVDDNDVPFVKATRAMLIQGLMDDEGQNGSGPNFIAVRALDNIADASIFGLGCANTGGGTDGIEWTFPAISLTKDSIYYIANDSLKFNLFFDFDADFIENSGGFGTVVSFNGDDAMELFENGRLIDVYGDQNVDGTGEVWEWEEGWAKRKSTVTKPKLLFDSEEWIFGGTNAVTGAMHNDSCSNPYFPVPVDPVGLPFTVIKTQSVNVYPNPASNLISVEGQGINKIIVMDILGNIIENKMVSTTVTRINIESYNSGVYLIKTEGIESSSIRFIKQ